MSKKLKFEGDRAKLRPKLSLLRQPWAKYLGKKKSLVSTLVSFLTATAKVQCLEGRLGTGLCLHPNWRFS